MALFNFIIKKSLDVYDMSLPIKTKDGSHPEGVHSKGTILFYRIYLRYGADVVRKLVQTFASLAEKTTKQFVSVVGREISSELAAFIENGIREPFFAPPQCRQHQKTIIDCKIKIGVIKFG